MSERLIEWKVYEKIGKTVINPLIILGIDIEEGDHDHELEIYLTHPNERIRGLAKERWIYIYPLPKDH